MALVWLSIAWLLGLLLARAVELPSFLALPALVLGVLLAYAGAHARSPSWALVLAPFALLAGWVAGPGPSALPEVPRGMARLEATVERVRYQASGTQATVLAHRASMVDGRATLPADLRVRVRDLDAPIGARVQLLVAIGPHAGFHNPSPHPRWLDARPVHADARLRGPAHIEASGPRAWLHAARGRLRAQLDATLPPHVAGVARALLLGDGGAVARDDADALRGAGLAHLLAVSGLHVALLVAAVFLLATHLLRGRVADARRTGALCAMPVALGFAMMAGGAPSAWRAALMAVFTLGCFALRRQPRPIAIAALAALVFAVLDPDDAVRPAFLLSITATAAILTLPIEPRGYVLEVEPPPQNVWQALRRHRGLRLSWQISWRTTLATAPLVVWCFQTLPPLGVLANVLLLPVATLALVPLAFLHALAAALGVPGPSAALLRLVVDGTVGAAEPFALGEHLPPPSVLQGVLLALLALVVLSRLRRRAALALLLVFGLGAEELALRRREAPRHLRATFLDVGQGDAALVDLPDGSAMLVDGGGRIPRVGGLDPGERALLPLLEARRRDRLRLVILSHPHPDHYGGLRALLDRVEVDELWTSGQALEETPHGPGAALLRAFERRGTRVRTAREVCGSHALGGARVEVRWPCGPGPDGEPGYDPGYDRNDNSLVVRVQDAAGGPAMLFTGDTEHFAEDALAALDVRAEVLKVPHHGSRTSSSDALLDAVRPQLAIASQGRSSRFGHPHDEVVERYRARGIPLLLTSEVGGVIVTLTSPPTWETAR